MIAGFQSGRIAVGVAGGQASHVASEERRAGIAAPAPGPLAGPAPPALRWEEPGHFSAVRKQQQLERHDHHRRAESHRHQPSARHHTRQSAGQLLLFTVHFESYPIWNCDAYRCSQQYSK